MMHAAHHSTPRPQAVLATQVRVVGCALRRPTLVASGLIALTTALVTLEFMRTGEPIDFDPTEQVLFGVLGLLLPIGVWMGEERFGACFLWTLPVDRRWHALARVFAGWVWLMGAVALFFLWLLALALLTGGRVLSEETLRVLPSVSSAPSPSFDPSVVQHVRWALAPALLARPFHRGDCGVSLGQRAARSARVIPCGGSSELSSAWFSFVLVSERGERGLPLEGWLRSLSRGPYGIDALLTARTETLAGVCDALDRRNDRGVARAAGPRGVGDCHVGVDGRRLAAARGRGLSASRIPASADTHGTTDSQPLQDLPQRRAGAEGRHPDDSPRDVRAARSERRRQVHADADDRHAAGAGRRVDLVFGDIDVLRQKDRVRETLGYLPQEFGVYPKVSAERLLDHFARAQGHRRAAARARRSSRRCCGRRTCGTCASRSSAATRAACASASASPWRCSAIRSS